MQDNRFYRNVGDLFMLLMPYGLVRWWLLTRRGYKIDEKLFYYTGIRKRLKRCVKFALPYCITMRYRTPYSDQVAAAPCADLPTGTDETACSSYAAEFAQISECLRRELQKKR